MRLATLIVSMMVPVSVFSDQCGDICTLIPGACSSKGSYCKNGYACMDLFWHTRGETLCNHENADCHGRSELTCPEATTIVQSGNRFRIRSVLHRSVAPATTIARPAPSSSAPIRRSELDGLVDLLRHSDRFMTAFRQPPQIPYWRGAVDVFEHGNDAAMTALHRAIIAEANSDPDGYRFWSWFDVLMRNLGDQNSAIKNVLEGQCDTAGACRGCGEDGRYVVRGYGMISMSGRARSGPIDLEHEIFMKMAAQVIQGRCFCFYQPSTHLSCLANLPSNLNADERIGFPSVLAYTLYNFEHHDILGSIVPMEIDLERHYTDATGRVPQESPRYRLVGFMRKVADDVHDVQFVSGSAAIAMDLSLVGVSGVVYERI